jgi:hypothetical protein
VTFLAGPVGLKLAVALLDDVLASGLRLASLALLLLALPIGLTMLGFGAILALFGGLSGAPQGGGPVLGGAPTATARAQIPADQLAVIQDVAASAPCPLPWTVLAAIANVESGFGKQADQFSSAGAYGYGQFLEPTWRAYAGDVPWRATDSNEQARPVGDRRDSTSYRHALPVMARYLCAEGAGQDLRKAIFAYNHADWYVAEILQLAARYGGIGAAGGGLINGWADRPPLNQYDRGHYGSDETWSVWRSAACSAAALAWLLGAYGQPVAALDDAVSLLGPGTGISPRLGLLDAR